VAGRLACVGTPKEITSRFCGFLVRPLVCGWQPQLCVRRVLCAPPRNNMWRHVACDAPSTSVTTPLLAPRANTHWQLLTVTVPAEAEAAAHALVAALAPSAALTYSVGGTLKFEMPLAEVGLLWCVREVCATRQRRPVLHSCLKYHHPHHTPHHTTRRTRTRPQQVSLGRVFAAMTGPQAAALGVVDWCAANAGLEDTFIRFARSTALQPSV
jgi:hypothetical protein